MKILILSDFHLGHAASRLPRMLAGLARVASSYDQVLINGDAVNALECDEDRAEAEPLLRQLSDALASRGGAPVMITGNHDPAVSPAHFMFFEEPGLLAFHGDFIIDNPAPWLRKGVDFQANFRRDLDAQSQGLDFAARAATFRKIQMEMLFERYEIKETRGWFRYVAKQFIPPTRPFTILRYIVKAPGRAAELAGGFGRPVRRVAFGHTHRAGQWSRRGMEIFNTGSYMPFSEPFALEIEGAQVRLEPVRLLVERKGVAVRVPEAVQARTEARSAPARAEGAKESLRA